MVLPVFPRNIPYRARPKSPPFNFFRHCETFFSDFFSKFFSLKGSPLHFFDVLRQNGRWKIPKGSSFQFCRHCEIFPENKKKFSSIFSCFATEWMLKNLKGSPIFSFFSALCDFFPKINFFSIFSCFATEWMLKNFKLFQHPPFRFSAL